MYTVSLTLQLPPCVNILNLCPDIKLTLPVYFGSGAICPKLSGQQIGIGTNMKAHFEINTTQNDFKGALLFKLRYSNSRHNMDTPITETNKATCIRMLLAWEVKDANLFMCVVLVEHSKELIWNEDKLKKLYDMNHDQFKQDTISNTWLVDNHTVLKTTFKVRGLKENPELSICISEEKKDDHAMRPLWIDATR
jgi:hypothetical protein